MRMTDRCVLFVAANPKPGRDDAFNEWYDGIHAQTMLSVDGFVGMRRYKFHSPLTADFPPLWQYLAAYDVVGTPELAGPRLLEKLATVDSSPGPDIDLSDTKAWFYSPIASIPPGATI
jgi:hypothetical protein